MASEDDDKPRKKITHEIGQDLSLLSVEELTERIALMNSEIERLQQAAAKKRASKDAANNFFKSEISVRDISSASSRPGAQLRTGAAHTRVFPRR